MLHSALPDAGRVTHVEIDAYLPTEAQKADLEDLLLGVVELKVSTDDTANPPTEAELVAAFGAAATVGAGFTAVLDDAGGGNNVYLVVSDGTNWWHVAMTKAA